MPWARAPVALAAVGGKLTKYMEPLPVPGAGIVVATQSAPNQYTFTQTEITRQLHPQLPPTPLWAYDDGSGLAGRAGAARQPPARQGGATCAARRRGRCAIQPLTSTRPGSSPLGVSAPARNQLPLAY
jgi:hypothetical protein